MELKDYDNSEKHFVKIRFFTRIPKVRTYDGHVYNGPTVNDDVIKDTILQRARSRRIGVGCCWA
ncbi:unnamed protein product [Nesidiocoris tenuis]|uniref:Uncharacterized protein n=1 Tax=Nesidiocoris tenuis TaxID=355587 RepID=A0A6H5HUD5_9HEMI|nr:unnamed protein product [Nesidiocoris tenuis]